MNICSSIKQKFNEAKLKGIDILRINIKNITKAEIEDLRECGYDVKLSNNQIIISE